VGGASEDHTTSYGGWLIATKEIGALAVTLTGDTSITTMGRRRSAMPAEAASGAYRPSPFNGGARHLFSFPVPTDSSTPSCA